MPHKPCQQAARVVLTYGAFDGFHPGHARQLQQMRRLGTELIVGCATDACLARHGRKALVPYEDRRALLEACRFVDRVIPEDSQFQKHTDIINYNVSVIAMGSNWQGRIDHLGDVAQVVYIDRPDLPLTERSAPDLRVGAV